MNKVCNIGIRSNVHWLCSDDSTKLSVCLLHYIPHLRDPLYIGLTSNIYVSTTFFAAVYVSISTDLLVT